jgi:uncharacterized protein (DUF433 family)
MRITVAVIVDRIAGGATVEDVLRELPDLETEDVRQAMAYAAWLSREQVTPA